MQTGLFAEASISLAAGLGTMDSPPPLKVSTKKVSLSHSLSGTRSGRKRDAPDAYEKTLERRLRRKIKKRESSVLAGSKTDL